MWTQIRLLLKEQSDLGSHCLQKMTFKITSRWQSRRQLLLAVKGLTKLDTLSEFSDTVTREIIFVITKTYLYNVDPTLNSTFIYEGPAKSFVTGFGLLQCYVLLNIFFITNLKSIPPLLKHIFATFLSSRDKQINSLLLVSVGDTGE